MWVAVGYVGLGLVSLLVEVPSLGKIFFLPLLYQMCN